MFEFRTYRISTLYQGIRASPPVHDGTDLAEASEPASAAMHGPATSALVGLTVDDVQAFDVRLLAGALLGAGRLPAGHHAIHSHRPAAKPAAEVMR